MCRSSHKMALPFPLILNLYMAALLVVAFLLNTEGTIMTDTKHLFKRQMGPMGPMGPMGGGGGRGGYGYGYG
uniref:Glycine-rich protein n=1 Tax=Globodera pallida TaxID=36090 RepID=A0A183C3M3_GLOPA